jgi:hypothetical protein
MVAISGQGKKHSVPPLAQQESSATGEEEEQATAAETSAPQQVSQGTGIPPCEMAFRPLTRIERRTLGSRNTASRTSRCSCGHAW